MAEQKNKEKKHKDAITEIAAILEELAGAFIMALLIIGFVVQPFIIPTGSMAETLRGMHFRQRCPQCGYRYVRNFEAEEYGLRNTQSPYGNVAPPVSRCPSCGFYNEILWPVDVARGDKILAIKCLYNFFEPKRWDVVVFKNPTLPPQNYIKRLIGKPHEKVEIIDGDVYINDEIARKPQKVQNELWMLVYNSAYEPVNPDLRKYNGHKWQIPFINYGDSLWQKTKNGNVIFELNSLEGREHRLAYDTTKGNGFGINYAYNRVEEFTKFPKCTDLQVCFSVDIKNKDNGSIAGAYLRKYQRTYKGWVDSENHAYIAELLDDREVLLNNKKFGNIDPLRPIEFQFSNVDHMLTLQVGKEKIRYDLGKSKDDIGIQKNEAEPEVEIFGTGHVKVWNVKIYRDIYYTSQTTYAQKFDGTAVQGNPICLGDDEFFVLGDNSPASLDGRWWYKEGIGNDGIPYTRGTVPRDYLIGKAIAVFWPSGYKPFEKFPLRLIPDVSQFRLIYGGSDKKSAP